MVTDAELLAKWNIPPLSVRLCKLRLLYSFQWYKEGPRTLHDIVTAEDVTERSWFAALRHGIQWMATMCENEGPVPVTTEETLQWIHERARNGAKQVRRAITRFLMQQHLIFDVLNGHNRIRKTLLQHQVHFPPAEDNSPMPCLYKCQHCEKTFDTAQALQGHVWSWHRRCSDERRYIYNDTCQACGVCYWTAQRVQQHLKSTRGDPHGCLAFLMEYFDPLDAPVKVTKPLELQRFHRLPCSATLGPHERPLMPAWRREQSRRLDECDAQWQALQYPTTVDQEEIDQYATRLSEITQKWHQEASHDAELLDDQWSQVFSQHPDEKVAMLAFLHWGRFGMYDTISQWDDPDDIEMVDRLFQGIAEHIPIWHLWTQRDVILNQQPPIQLHLHQDPSAPKQAASRGEREPIMDHLKEQRSLIRPVAGQWATGRIQVNGVPILQDAQGRRYLVILHMFAGRRRDEDCCHWAHELKKEYFADEPFEILVLSVDTAVDAILGNLDQGDNFESILSLAESGAVALGMSGPPCETWSAARHLAIESEGAQHGPRPLRTRDLLWGQQHRTLRELRQVGTGNRLMLNAILVEVTIAAHGGVSMMEHPDEPRQAEHASVWRTELHQTLLPSVLRMEKHHLQQWKFGGKAVKPTMIRTFGMPRSYSEFQRHELPGLVKPTHHLGGIDETTGQFKTSSAKEYPPGFCKALIAVAFSNLARRLRAEGARIVQVSQLEERARTWTYSMIESGKTVDQTAQWLPDYQPQ